MDSSKFNHSLLIEHVKGHSSVLGGGGGELLLIPGSLPPTWAGKAHMKLEHKSRRWAPSDPQVPTAQRWWKSVWEDVRGSTGVSDEF